MRNKSLWIISCIFTSCLIVGNFSLGIFSNWIATYFQEWGIQNRTAIIAATSGLIAIMIVFTIILDQLLSPKEIHPPSKRTSRVTGQDVLYTIYKAYRESPGEKVQLKTIWKTLHLSEEQAIDLVRKLEQQGFVKPTWMDRNALVEITADGIAILKDD